MVSRQEQGNDSVNHDRVKELKKNVRRTKRELDAAINRLESLRIDNDSLGLGISETGANEECDAAYDAHQAAVDEFERYSLTEAI